MVLGEDCVKGVGDSDVDGRDSWSVCRHIEKEGNEKGIEESSLERKVDNAEKWTLDIDRSGMTQKG
jgi:hypothetical protein